MGGGSAWSMHDVCRAVQVKANKAACFDGGLQELHVTALVDGLIASSSNHLLCLALVDAVAALVAEPENCNTPEPVQMCGTVPRHAGLPPCCALCYVVS